MTPKMIPMMHVPDVQQAIDWYQSIGFVLQRSHQEPGCPLDWALLLCGDSELMLSLGGQPASSPRRDFDLYIQVDDLESRVPSLHRLAQVVEDLHLTHYGMREVIIKDPNGFWITFAQSPDPG